MTLVNPRPAKRCYGKTINTCKRCGAQFQPDGRGNHKAKYCRPCRYELKKRKYRPVIKQ